MAGKDISVSILGELEAEVNKEARATALNILKLVVLATPVGNPELWKSNPPPGYTGGSARANWMVGINSPNRGIVSGEDKNGSSTIAKGNSQIAKAKAKKYPEIIISNNLPYIQRLNDGWSTQAPKKFVETAVKRVSNAR